MKGHTPGMSHEMSGGAHDDKRTPLKIPPMMKNHVMGNMRDHLAAVNESVKLIGSGNFEAASRVIHDRLGTNEEMAKMCGMFGNETYRDMGLAMHASADALSAEIKSKDMGKIMKALSGTLEKCVACHDTFRLE
jgi:cytochrome c556